MNITLPVHTSVPPPSPQPTHTVNMAVVYFVSRMSGEVREVSIGEREFRNISALQWESRDSLANRYPYGTIFIPVDMMTAVNLKLVPIEEFQLPEGFKALFNILR